MSENLKKALGLEDHCHHLGMGGLMKLWHHAAQVECGYCLSSPVACYDYSGPIAVVDVVVVVHFFQASHDNVWVVHHQSDKHQEHPDRMGSSPSTSLY